MSGARLPYSGRRHADAVPGAPAVLARDLTVVYPGAGRPALDRVSVRVAPGQRLTLVGPNGAGKSTLLRTLAGLVRPAGGVVLIHGNPVGACHHRVAYVPQRGEVDWGFPITVRRLVTAGRYPHLGWLRRPGPRDRARTEGALAEMDLLHLAERQIGRLSGGQRQRALIARALAQEAELMLLDEPFTAIDADARRALRRALAGVADRGVTTVVATHHPDELEGGGAVLRLAAGVAVDDRVAEAAWAG